MRPWLGSPGSGSASGVCWPSFGPGPWPGSGGDPIGTGSDGEPLAAAATLEVGPDLPGTTRGLPRGVPFRRRVQEVACRRRPRLVAKGDPDEPVVLERMRQAIAGLPQGVILLAEDRPPPGVPTEPVSGPHRRKL